MADVTYNLVDGDVVSAAIMQQIKTAVNSKVDKVDGKGLSKNDYTDAEKTKLVGLPSSVYSQIQVDDALTGKQDKIAGKGLSTEDYTTAEKTKLAGLSIGTTAGTVAAGDDTRITGAAQKANNLSDLANVATARTNLGIVKRSTFSNADYSVLSTDYYVAQIGTLTLPRTATLPAASSVQAGWEIIIADESGSVTTTNTITIARTGTDTIAGATSEVIGAAYGWRRFISNGSNAWLMDRGVLRAVNNLSELSNTTTARNNLGLGALATKANVDLSGSDATGTMAAARMPALTGDVTSSSGAVATTVGKIQGRTVASTAPTAGQGLVWNNTTSQWEPTTLSSGGGLTKTTGTGTTQTLTLVSNGFANHQHSTTGNTVFTFSNPSGFGGEELTLCVTIGSSGHTITVNDYGGSALAAARWPAGAVPTFYSTANAVVIMSFKVVSGVIRCTGLAQYSS